MLSESQRANKAWWADNPMAYDWHGTLAFTPGTREWFEEIDRRFMASAYYARGTDGTPFGRFLKPEIVAGKNVLEVGCGMGTHAAMLARGGARLTAIDITERAIAASRRRFEIFGLAAARIDQADCEQLPFSNASFDMVWSWGVIHHSSSTEQCLAEITRVLRPGGRLFLMIYYKRSIVYYVHCGLVRGVFFGQLLSRSLDKIYQNASDGFYARVFTKNELKALLRPNYDPVVINIVGMKSELLPIPRCRLKEKVEELIPDWLASAILSRWGSMVVVDAQKKSHATESPEF
ncbi:MAG: class I SAM-dependent methyltransferase [Deltaproteobacteria bacterium]|nr:class I SAM-dependent methyltransferase [Deltaproteobacteria bacterium]